MPASPFVCPPPKYCARISCPLRKTDISVENTTHGCPARFSFTMFARTFRCEITFADIIIFAFEARMVVVLMRVEVLH